MTNPSFILLDSGTEFRKQLGEDRTLQVKKIAEVDSALKLSSKQSLWILSDKRLLDGFVKSLVHFGMHHSKNPDLGQLLFFSPPARQSIIPPLQTYFRTIAGDVDTFEILPRHELAVALTSARRCDLFIGGSVDHNSESMTLIRGDMRPLVVPISIFKQSGVAEPDFHQFALTDYGDAVRLGDYESSSHAILFEVDRDYRRRFNQQRVQSEKGFGPSLRRLRTMRRLSRGSFAGISAKTIARIERGQTGKPQAATLDQIARTLGVAPDEIETF